MHRRTTAGQHVESRHHCAEILPLILTLKIHSLKDIFVTCPKRRLDLIRKCQQRHDCITIPHEIRFRKIGIQHFTFKDRISLRMALAHHNRDLRLDDPGLLEGNFRKRPAQHVAMVQTYVSYDAEDRRHDVRAVKTSSQTCFKNDNVHLPGGKPIKCHQSGNLKERKVQMIECILPLLNE